MSGYACVNNKEFYRKSPIANTLYWQLSWSQNSLSKPTPLSKMFYNLPIGKRQVAFVGIILECAASHAVSFVIIWIVTAGRRIATFVVLFLSDGKYIITALNSEWNSAVSIILSFNQKN